MWCAAVSGKLDVIQCLVKNGANVNAESDSGSTPVRSACFMTHLEIGLYNVFVKKKDVHADSLDNNVIF